MKGRVNHFILVSHLSLLAGGAWYEEQVALETHGIIG